MVKEDGGDRVPALDADLGDHVLEQGLADGVWPRQDCLANPDPDGRQLLDAQFEVLALLGRLAEFELLALSARSLSLSASIRGAQRSSAMVSFSKAAK